MPGDSTQVDTAEDRSTWQKAENTFRGKGRSEYFDPCQEAAARSIRCLHRNGGDREMCSDFFAAYRECKKDWVTERRFQLKPSSS